MRDDTMTSTLILGIRRVLARVGSAAAVSGVLAGGVAAQPATPGLETLLADLRNPSARHRVNTLEMLGNLARPEAAVPIAALLPDPNDGVQLAAIDALLALYTVRADLRQRQWGAGSVGRTATLPESAFEAGPLATIPAAVPGEVLSGLASVMRQDDALKIRLAAAYALGVLAAPALGPMSGTAAPSVEKDLAASLAHVDSPTREVVARVAGRIFESSSSVRVAHVVGDALITAMNDPDPLVRRWAMDSLGRMRYSLAVQALHDRASFYSKGEEAAAALHALARIAAPLSASVFRTLLTNGYMPFRVIAIEGLARIGDTAALPEIAQSAASARNENVSLAAAFAQLLLKQTQDPTPIAQALARNDTLVQARVYLAELAQRAPESLKPLLTAPSPWVRRGTVEVLGASRQPALVALIQPMLQDGSADVIQAASEAMRRLQAYATLAGPASTP
jgi:HEAT repeat protein